MLNRPDLRSLTVHVGGRLVSDPWDRVARYCGLPWSGGDDETWAFRYYDATIDPTEAEQVTPVDVMTTAALHPGLSKTDLAFFVDAREELAGWLADLPRDVALADADEDTVARLQALSGWDVPVSLALLTKVLHRKRPALVPLLDRHLVDEYRFETGQRSPRNAWPPLVRALAHDTSATTNPALAAMVQAVHGSTGVCLSPLRVLDIVVWMATAGTKATNQR